MHLNARIKSHILRRVMELFPGLCPGVVLRQIGATIESSPPLIACNGEALYRVSIGGIVICVVMLTLSKRLVTVMTVPCRGHVASRVYQIGAETIEKVKNENAKFRDDKWRQLRRSHEARKRFL